MKNNILKEKSYSFALRIVKLYQYLAAEHREYVLSKQVLEEAFQGESKSDFIHKLSIANKEAFETHYWLRLLRDSNILTDAQAESLIVECDEVQRMLVAAIKTSKLRK
jgi:four helix bundle protein